MGYWYRGAWSDSQTLQIAYDDPGLIYGASVFTTCRVYDDSLDHPLTHWSEHQQRLQSSLEAFGWQQPDWPQVLAGVQLTARQHPVVRITLFADGRELIWGRALPANLELQQQLGISTSVVTNLNRSLPGHKTGNYLAPWLARQQVPIGSEAILVNSSGEWLETSTGNLWGWQGDIWYTPPLEAGLLSGISRAYLVQWLQSQGKIVREETWDHSLVAQLTGIAYSNAVVQWIPIHTVQHGSEQRSYRISPQVIALIAQAFQV